MIVSSKLPTKFFLDFCPEIFCSFLGASWMLFGLPGDLVSNIIDKEAYKKPQKISEQRSGNILLVFWMKLSFHKDIIKLTDL